ncbi:MAG: hypothetical protein AB1490_23750 [Pseudomonadota bacterium]
MRTRILVIAAVAMFGIGSAIGGGTAKATVAGPHSTLQEQTRPLDFVHKARRICERVFRCGEMGQGCWWEQKCHVTPDYPPENGDGRDRR